LGSFSGTGGVLNNSYSTGDVVGITLQTGGLIGYSQGNIVNSFSTGNVTSNVAVTGLVGVKRSGTISNSYWYNRSNGIDNCWSNNTGKYNIGCIAITKVDYFNNYDNSPMNLTAGNGWDFTNVWSNSGNGTSYPTLQG